MTRRAALAVALFVGMTLVVAGCGSHGDQNPTPGPSVVASDEASGSPGPGATTALATPFPSDPYGSPPVPDSPVAGVILAVEEGPSASPPARASDANAGVGAFSFRSTSGVTMAFLIGQVDDLDVFPLSSLADHVDSQVPVLVWFRVTGSDLVVYHLEDAP